MVLYCSVDNRDKTPSSCFLFVYFFLVFSHFSHQNLNAHRQMYNVLQYYYYSASFGQKLSRLLRKGKCTRQRPNKSERYAAALPNTTVDRPSPKRTHTKNPISVYVLLEVMGKAPNLQTSSRQDDPASAESISKFCKRRA